MSVLDMNTLEVVIFGGTYSNKGGLAIIKGTLKVLKEIGITFKYIIDPDRSFTRDFFSAFGLRPIYRYSGVLWDKPTPQVAPKYVIKPFVKCVINSFSYRIRQLRNIPIWYIGDSALNDYRSLLSLFGQIVSLYSLKKATNGKLIIGGVSLGRSKTKIGDLLLRFLFKSVDYFFIRGRVSYDYVVRLGVPRHKISLIYDFAFHLNQEASEKSKKLSEMIRRSDKPIIGLIFGQPIFGQNIADYVKRIKMLFSELSAQNYKVFFVPMSFSNFIPENDLIFLKEMVNVDERFILNLENLSPEEIIHVLSNFDAVITTRLHGAIYGILAGIPVIHIYGTHASLDLIKDIFKEIVPLIHISEFFKDDTIKQIVETLAELLPRKNEISKRMKILVEKIREYSINELKRFLNCLE